ncbi:MAG: AAA family ATPase [Planctomycetes bacterium]|nr:AAA family ATPase [Planctomycetota bacterium]
MIQEYLQYWGLKSVPFSLTPDPRLLYPSKQHRECLMRLKYAVHSNKGGALVISDHAGDGKTTLIRRLIGDLEAELRHSVAVALIDHPTLTPNQMVQEIALQLGVQKPSRQRHQNLNQLRERLNYYRNLGTKTVIIVDEGQMLADRIDTLQELRILLNFSMTADFLLTFVLMGQKALEDTIRKIPEFWQRLPVRYFLGNLDRRETEEMVRFRLQQCGHAGGDIFTEDGYDAIFHYTKGIPRVICSVADLCLLIGYSSRVRVLDMLVVHEASQDMDGSEQGFHYYKFLREEERKAPLEAASDVGQAGPAQ